MNFLSIVNFFDFTVYFYITAYALIKNPKSPLNQVCSMFTFCFCIWSFGMIFIQNQFISKSTVGLIHLLISFGWIAFPSFFIWFILILTENNKVLKSKLILPFLFSIPVVFIYEQFRGRLISDYIKQSWGWAHVWSNSIWSYLFYFYYASFIVAGLYLTLNFIRTSGSIPKKRSAIVILFAGAFSLVAASLTDVVLPIAHIYTIPNLASFFVLVWVFGLVYTIVKYRFLSITPYIATDNIISTMADSLILLNESSTIVFINKATSDLLGWRSDELMGEKLEVLFPEDFKSAQLNGILQEPGIQDHDFYLQAKSGKDIPVIFTVSPLEAAGEAIGTVCIAKDISKRKQTEKELRGAYEQLKQAQLQLTRSAKMASVGLLATGVAHEINNPLAVISGEAYMLLKDENKDQETRDSSKNILEQSERIKKITTRLLEFSRNKEPKRQLLDVHQDIEKSISLLTYQAKIEKIEIAKEWGVGLPRIWADGGQLQEVFLNIMLNAVQMMENGGTLTIRTYGEEVTEYAASKTDKFKPGDRIVAIEIKDTGKGMDDETLKKVFEPFFSTKEKGVGLGLFICYGIIDNHGGVIEAQSKLGGGSTFIVQLPVPKERGELR